MKNFGTVGERYCPAKGQNVPVEIWWDSDGNRQEQCLNQGSCTHQAGYADSRTAPCKKEVSC